MLFRLSGSGHPTSQGGELNAAPRGFNHLQGAGITLRPIHPRGRQQYLSFFVASLPTAYTYRLLQIMLSPDAAGSARS